jgi:hypothetical protein
MKTVSLKTPVLQGLMFAVANSISGIIVGTKLLLGWLLAMAVPSSNGFLENFSPLSWRRRHLHRLPEPRCLSRPPAARRRPAQAPQDQHPEQRLLDIEKVCASQTGTGAGFFPPQRRGGSPLRRGGR